MTFSTDSKLVFYLFQHVYIIVIAFLYSCFWDDFAMLMCHSIAIQQTWLDEFRLQAEKCSTISRSIGIQEGCIFSPLIPVIQNSISLMQKKKKKKPQHLTTNNSSQTAVPCDNILIYAIKSCLLLLSCYLNPFKTLQDSLPKYLGSLAM